MTESTHKPSSVQSKLALGIQFGLIAGPFLSMIDSNVVNVALPVIQQQFHAGLASVQWILSAYLLSSGAALVMSPYLSKRFGAGRVYLLSLLGFTLASALCAFALNLEFLVAARVLQGALGAVMVPLAMDMLLGKKGASTQISPAFGLILFLAPALGPTVGGFLISAAGWPSVFLLNVPLGLVSALIIFRSRNSWRKEKVARALKFDWVGALVLAAGVVLSLYGATQGELLGWFSKGALPFWLTGIPFLIFYAAWAEKNPSPAVNLKLLRSGQTALALIIMTIASVVLFAILFLLPIFIQQIQGASASISGLVLLPQGIVTGIGTWIGDVISKDKGHARVRLATIGGMGILTITTAMLLSVNASTSDWLVALILSGRGIALGLVIQPLLVSTIGNLPSQDVPDGNTLFNVFDRLGGSIGISLLATFFQFRVLSYIQSGSASAAELQGFHDTILPLTAAAFAGFVLSFLMRKDTKTSPEGEMQKSSSLIV